MHFIGFLVVRECNITHTHTHLLSRMGNIYLSDCGYKSKICASNLLFDGNGACRSGFKPQLNGFLISHLRWSGRHGPSLAGGRSHCIAACEIGSLRQLQNYKPSVEYKMYFSLKTKFALHPWQLLLYHFESARANMGTTEHINVLYLFIVKPASSFCAMDSH